MAIKKLKDMKPGESGLIVQGNHRQRITGAHGLAH